MRKIEQQMITALKERRNWQESNTSVHWESGVATVHLFGNLIARYAPDEGEVSISDAGWRSATTKSRLNAILETFTGFNIFQRDFTWYITNGHESEPIYSPTSNGLTLKIETESPAGD